MELSGRQAWNNLGLLAYLQGHYAVARTYFDESLAEARQARNKPDMAMLIQLLAAVATQQASRRDAPPPGLETAGVPEPLSNGDDSGRAVAQWAARLLGAAMKWRETSGVQMERQEQQISEQATTTVRALLGEEAFAQAWQGGRALTLEEAVDIAIDSTQTRDK